MNSPINIGTAPATARITSAGTPPTAAGASDFTGLVALAGGEASRPTGTGHGPAAMSGTPLPPAPGETELAGKLGRLLEGLSALLVGIEEGGGPEETELDDLEALLGEIEALLQGDTPLPLPDSPAFAALADLAAALGLEATPDTAIAPLDAMAGLAAKLAGHLREAAPDLAVRLTRLSRALDGQAADIQTALAETKAGAIIDSRQIESETRLNPAATLAAQTETGLSRPSAPGAESAQNAPVADRSLVKEGQGGTPPEARAPQNQPGPAGAPAASTAPAEAPTPDGLIVQSPQAPPATAGQAGAMRPEAAAYQRPDNQINLPFVAAEISRHVQNGLSRFEIRLNPPELGRIDVRMEMDGSGNVIARLAVERSETLDLLQRDQRALERALAEAGLDSAKTDLEFSLQQQGGDGGAEGEDAPWRQTSIAIADIEAANAPAHAGPGPYIGGYARLDAVNLWV